MNAPLQDKKVLQAGDTDLWLKTPDLSISIGELADSVRTGDLYHDSKLRVSAVEGTVSYTHLTLPTICSV